MRLINEGHVDFMIFIVFVNKVSWLDDRFVITHAQFFDDLPIDLDLLGMIDHHHGVKLILFGQLVKDVAHQYRFTGSCLASHQNQLTGLVFSQRLFNGFKNLFLGLILLVSQLIERRGLKDCRLFQKLTRWKQVAILLIFTQLVPDAVKDRNELLARVVLALGIFTAIVQLRDHVHAAQVLHHAVFDV